jgi:hypothetical protein
MAKYVKNPDGGIHSVPDDFEAPQEWGQKGENWLELLEDEARALVGHLFGKPHPDVVAAEVHDRGVDEKTAVSEDASLYPGDNVTAAGSQELVQGPEAVADETDPRAVAVQQKKRAEAAEAEVEYLRQQLTHAESLVPEPQPVDADGNLIPTPTDEGEPNVEAPASSEPEAPAAPAEESAE